jgi:polyisoprenoid-binding protein YceI
MSDPKRLRIDPELSEVTLAARSSVHPIIAGARPRGWFEGVLDGAFSDDGAMHGHIEIPVEDLSSGNRLIDRETRRRIDATAYPLIVGDLTGVVQAEPLRVVVEGEVEFYGQSVLLEGELHLERSPENAPIIVGEGTVDVRWWGLNPPRLLVLKVDPEIEVSVRLVLVP